VLVVCLGSLTYGYAISVLATTLTKSEFYVYFQLETEGAGKTYANAIIATWNCLLYVGAVIGGILYMNISNRWGRKMPLAVGSCFTIIGSALQAGSVDVAMLATARAVIGVGLGLLLPGIPLYQAEVSPPHGRGFMVGLHGESRPVCHHNEWK
jgi:MFS family permease